MNPSALATEGHAQIPKLFSAFIYQWRILAAGAVFIGYATKPDILYDIDIAIIGRATIPTLLPISGYFTALSMYSSSRFLKKFVKHYCSMLTMFIPASFLNFFMDLHIIYAGAPLMIMFKFYPDLFLHG